ncbi:hypothetical protein NEA10_04730 [Phormidium yuhuli AB48]|uniref:Uncharacterized protein n=1 Tax=Phormidium yuhuli AB48 TaxID=2940671 RepID=A0ABY5AT59_9CYAN|nr:hypothetical protein [Phormidium yuhuli]USR92033.1 hypothetical protein NEA10_04730 [Phormidium yuhuli AB48]
MNQDYNQIKTGDVVDMRLKEIRARVEELLKAWNENFNDEDKKVKESLELVIQSIDNWLKEASKADEEVNRQIYYNEDNPFD